MALAETLTTVKEAVLERIPAPIRPFLPFAPAALAMGGMVVGIAWNSVFLHRIDDPRTRFRLFGVLVVLGFLLIIERRVQTRRLGWRWFEDRPRIIAFATLVCIGSLFNATLVYYFRSAASLKMYLFGAVLLFTIAFARLLKERAGGEVMRLLTFLLCSVSLFLFLIPLATGTLGSSTFILSAMVALVLNTGVWLLSRLRFSAVLDVLRNPTAFPAVLHRTTLKDVVIHGLAWTLALGGLGTLSLLHAIPPVPLVIVQSGVFHDITRTEAGYVGHFEERGIWPFSSGEDRPFYLDEGDRVHFFTSLFAPSGMDLTLVHRWDFWDPEEGWVTEDRLSFQVRGGRDGGFRGSTRKRAVWVGSWRVVVEMENGREIGRRRFEIVEGDGRGGMGEVVFE